MNGSEYLFRVLKGRFKQLVSMETRAKAIYGDKYKSMPAEFLAQEGIAGVILGTGHGLADEPQFDIDDFGTFYGKEENGEYFVWFEVADPQSLTTSIIKIRSILGFIDWEDAIGQANEIDTTFIQKLIASVLKNNFTRNKKFELRNEDVARAAQLVLWTFFDTVFNALALNKTVNLSGLGSFSRNDKREAVFAPDERIVDAVKLFYLRKKPIPPHSPVHKIVIESSAEEIEEVLNMDVDAQARAMVNELVRDGMPEKHREPMVKLFKKQLEEQKKNYAQMKNKKKED